MAGFTKTSFFDLLGLARFSLRGSETSAGLDPGNVTAFITGLTFVSASGFINGTMTAISVEVAVPEPRTVLLLALVERRPYRPRKC